MTMRNRVNTRRRIGWIEQLDDRRMFTCPPSLLFELDGRGYVEDIWRHVASAERSYLLPSGDFSVDFELLEGNLGYSVASISGTISDRVFEASVSHSTEYFPENLLWRGSSIALTVQAWALVPAGSTATLTVATAGSITMESSQTINTVSADASTFLGRAVEPRPSQANGDFPFDASGSWTANADATKEFSQYPGWTYRRIFYSSLSSSQTVVADWNQRGHGKIVTEYYAWLDIDNIGMPPVAVITELESSGYHGVGNQLQFTAGNSYDPDDMGCSAESLAYEWKLIEWNTENLIAAGSEVEFWYTFDTPGRYKLELTVVDNEGIHASTFEILDIGLDFLTAVVHGWTPFESDIGQTVSQTKEFADKYSDFAFDSKPLYATESSIPFTWDSHASFGEAIGYQVLNQVLYRLAGVLIKRNALVPAAWTASMAILAEAFALSYSSSSRLKAKLAAETLAKAIGEPNKERAGDKSLILNLIGHSRGGFVATEAARVLESRYQISTCSVNVLDATGFDWPELISVVFDGNPVPNSDAKITNNWRVQDGLFSVSGRHLASAVAESLNGLASQLGVPEVQEFFSKSSTIEEIDLVLHQLIDESDLKAPIRGDFDGNTTVIDDVVHSNHSNVDDIYFSSTKYLQTSPVYGENYKKCIRVGEAERSNVGDFGLLLTHNDQHGVSYSLSIRDLARLKSIALSISNQSIVADPWVQSIQKLFFHPRSIESLINGKGAVEVVASTTGELGGISLSARSGESSIHQSFQIEQSGDKVVASITYNPNDVSEDSIIEIAVGDLVLAQQQLREVAGDLIEAEIPNSIWGVTEITVRLKSSSVSNEAKVLITDIRLASQLHSVELSANQATFLAGTSPEFTLRAWDVWNGGEPTPVVFYLETNDVAGLQEGESGDQLLAEVVFSDFHAIAIPGEWGDGESVTVHASLTDATGSRFTVTAHSVSISPQPLLQNAKLRFDVNRDGIATPLDALIVINDLNRNGMRWVPTDTPSYLLKALDVSGDQHIDPMDALQVINYLNRQTGQGSEGEHVDRVDFASIDDLYATIGYFADDDIRKRKARW
jgi:hypothetical protein